MTPLTPRCGDPADRPLGVLRQVADGSLRCFASLADRYTRRGVDPAPLAQHGLVDELLARLRAVGQTGAGTAAVGAGE